MLYRLGGLGDPLHLSIESETQVIGFSYKNVTIRFRSCFLFDLL